MTIPVHSLDLSTHSFDDSANGPLKDILVLDLSRLVAGNMLSMQLGDFGAEILKIENTKGGDPLRDWKQVLTNPPGEFDGWWQVYGRNKRSLAINLRIEEGKNLLIQLVKRADVLIESFKPGTLEKMGLSPSILHKHNPKLVIVRISGWGQTGPYRELPGFGSLVEGFSGYAEKHKQDTKPILPNMALADMIAGLNGAFATMVALRAAQVSDKGGQVVDLSLLEPMLSIMGPDAANFAATGIEQSATEKIASPRGAFRCKDGKWVSLSGSTETMAQRVFQVIGKDELYQDPRFSTNSARIKHDEILTQMIGSFIKDYERVECLELFRKAGVTVGPIYDMKGLMADPHIKERNVYVKTHQEGKDQSVVMHNITPTLTGTPGMLRRPAPRLGQHTQEVLTDLGIDATEIARLTQMEVVQCE